MTSDFSDSPSPFGEREKPPPENEDAYQQEPASEWLPFQSKVTASTVCWRCEKTVNGDPLRCPYCRAQLREESAPEQKVREFTKGSDSAAMPFIWFFLGTLTVSVIYFLILHHSATPGAGVDSAVPFLIGFEIVDTILVVIALAVCWRRLPPAPERSIQAQGAAWLASGFILAAAMGLNFAYFHFLRHTLGIEDVDLGLEVTTMSVLLICVQPAIIEELFFRYIGLGALCRAMSIHSAIVVTGVMFGFAHLGNPLGIPYLILLGIVLGYCRWWSGSIALPMTLHFIQNLIVLMAG